jgi:hypothetical protein
MAHYATISVPASTKKLNVPTGLFINNEFVSSADSKELIQQVVCHQITPLSYEHCSH